MKINISKEDYSNVLMAIAVASAAMPGFRMEYDALRKNLEDAWDLAIEENILSRIAAAKGE